MPVSVKTRIGYNKNELETWLPELLVEEPAAITIHARTRKEMSKVPARMEHVRRGVEIRNALQKETLILGNGDVVSIEDGYKKCQETGADGMMLGRAIFGNPWLFAQLAHAKRGSQLDRPPFAGSSTISIQERLRVMLEHTKLFDKLLGKHKNFALMKKHYKAYVNGWDGAKELRIKLMEAGSVEEVEKIVVNYLSCNPEA